jgi:hypothetical protein
MILASEHPQGTELVTQGIENPIFQISKVFIMTVIDYFHPFLNYNKIKWCSIKNLI